MDCWYCIYLPQTGCDKHISFFITIKQVWGLLILYLFTSIRSEMGMRNIYISFITIKWGWNRCEDGWSCIYLPQTGLRWVWGSYIFPLSQSNRCEDSQINGKKYSSNMSEEYKYNINMFEEIKKKQKHQTCEF